MLVAAFVSTACIASRVIAAPARTASISIAGQALVKRDTDHEVKLVQMGRVPERDANNYFSMAGSDMTSTLACPTRTDVHVSRLRPEDFKGELQLWPYPKEYSQCYFKPHESLLQAAKGPDGEDGWYGLPNAEIGGVIGSIECQKIGDHARQDLVGGDCTILKNDKVDCPAGCDQCGSSRRAFIGCRW